MSLWILQNVEDLTSWSIISWSSTLIYEVSQEHDKTCMQYQELSSLTTLCHLAIICWIYSTVHRTAITNTPFVTKFDLFNVISIAHISVYASKSSWVTSHAMIEQVFVWMTVQDTAIYLLSDSFNLIFIHLIYEAICYLSNSQKSTIYEFGNNKVER